MLEVPVIIILIGCSTLLVGYILRLSFLSKCSDVNFLCIKCHRETAQEQQNVSPLKLDIGKAISL